MKLKTFKRFDTFSKQHRLSTKNNLFLKLLRNMQRRRIRGDVRALVSEQLKRSSHIAIVKFDQVLKHDEHKTMGKRKRKYVNFGPHTVLLYVHALL